MNEQEAQAIVNQIARAIAFRLEKNRRPVYFARIQGRIYRFEAEIKIKASTATGDVVSE